ncbi:MAG: double zinc ribbon domain-containing protein [Anaerolineae bacterium]
MPISPDLMNTIVVVLEIILALLGGFLAALWISLVIWTFRDIRSRTRDIFAQLLATLLVLVFNIPGLLLYLILRPPERLSEAYERALEEEALLQDIEERAVCPACKRQVEKDFILCPACHTPLKKRCPECGRVLQLRWSICPYCGAPQDGAGETMEPSEFGETFPQPQALLDDAGMETAAWPASSGPSSSTMEES